MEKQTFVTDEDWTSFLTTFLIHPDFLPLNESRNGGNPGDLADNEQLVLNTIRLDDGVTMIKMVEQTGLSKATVERVVKVMKERLLVEKVLPQKGKWIILK